MPGRPDRYRVLIAGGGVAALEAMVALRTLAEDRVDIELLAPDRDFYYRPLAVTEPFGAGETLRFDIRALATGCGAQHRLGSLAAVSPGKHQATHGPRGSASLRLSDPGHRRAPVHRRSGSTDLPGEPGLACVLRILAEALSGDIKTLAFVVPSRATWPLPLYELALQTATKLAEEEIEVEIRLLTPEEAPLGVSRTQWVRGRRQSSRRQGHRALEWSACRQVRRGAR